MGITSKEPDQNAKPMLEIVGVSKSFGGVRALIESNFSCLSGEVHALLGENGAGKSTLVKILCGVVKKDSGIILINGEEVKINNPNDAEGYGIAAVFQELSLVQDLSVAENVYLTHEPKDRLGLIDFKKMYKNAGKLFSDLGLEIDEKAIVRDLPLSQQQMVEIAKALSKNPKIIIFDEATSALGKKEVEQLFALIKRLKAQGKTSIFISHRMEEINLIADRATVFRDARHVATFKIGTADNEQIINWITGHKVREIFPSKSREPADEISLEIDGLCSGRKLKNISLKAKKGEIIGIAGLAGHGQREFLRALYGAFPVDKAQIKVYGQKADIKNPQTAIKAGVVMVPEDRKNEGLLLQQSVKENLTLMILDRIQKAGLISNKKEREKSEEAINLLSIKTPDIDHSVVNMSGGNQQKVVIGKAILTQARIMLLEDPTRGIDVGTKTEVYRIMSKLAGEGVTILFYSTELSELVGVCSRVLVFKQGQVVAELTGNRISEHNIINYALGIA